MSANPVYITQRLATITCWNCAITFGVPERFERDRRNDHESFYCPSGHVNVFSGESELEKARKEAAWAKSQMEVARREADGARGERRRIRIRYVNLKKRVKRGKCPVAKCKVHFADLQKHLKTHRKFR